MTTAFYPISFSSPAAAWTAFSAGAAVFGAPVPCALAALVADGAAPVTEEEIDALLDAAYAMAGDGNATGIGLQVWSGGERQPNSYTDRRPGEMTVSFGTGRSSVHMDIVRYDGGVSMVVACHVEFGGPVSSPADLISAADSLRRRWEAVMAHAEPVEAIDEADIVIYRTPRQDEDDQEA